MLYIIKIYKYTKERDINNMLYIYRNYTYIEWKALFYGKIHLKNRFPSMIKKNCYMGNK